MINEVIDNMFKFDVDFNPDGGESELHLGRRHIYKNGPIFKLGSNPLGVGKSIQLINCIVELDLDGNLDTFRASVFAEGFGGKDSKESKVLMGEYQNTGWRYDSYRDIYSDRRSEREAQMRAIEKVKERTKKPFIETIRFLAKFVIERHTQLADRSEQERRQKERREREALERRMAKLRAELETKRRTVGKRFGESRMLLKMLVNETINRYLFENSLWKNNDMIMENYRFGNRVRGIVHEAVKRVLREHEPDEPYYWPDEGYYDYEKHLHDCEKECSLEFWIDPLTKEIFEDGDEFDDDDCVNLIITPVFTEYEYWFDLEDIDYELWTGDEERDAYYYKQLGDFINQYINDNYDDLANKIKDRSPYTIHI